MHFGVLFFATEYATSPVEVARTAEALGFESFWVPEHTHVPEARKTPWPGGAELPKHYHHLLDPLVTLSAVSSVTTKIKLGTAVVIQTVRDPILTAKAVATLDQLSGGRVLLGVGGGWNLEEIADHRTDPATRWKLLRERVDAMKAIWTNDLAEYHGEFVDFGPMWCWPKPLQKPHPPIVVGGHGPLAIARTIRYGDVWGPFLERLHKPFGELVADLQREAEAAGRGRIPVYVFAAPNDPKGLEELERIGVERAIFALPPNVPEGVLPKLEQLGKLIRTLA